MKIKSSKFIPMTVALAAAALFAIGFQAKADVPVEFSGGNGSPLTFTLTSPVSYTITTTPQTGSAFFIFQNVGDLTSNNNDGVFSVTGNIKFSINSGTPYVINEVYNNVNGVLTVNDLELFNGSYPQFSIGEVVTLTSGTFTTTTSVSVAPPESQNYRTFMAGGAPAMPVSTDGAQAVPEPSAFLLFGLGGLALLFFRKRLISVA